MPELFEKDAMVCRACGNEERASEGYPCADCGTFLCVMCNFRGVRKCSSCSKEPVRQPALTPNEIPLIDWPEH